MSSERVLEADVGVVGAGPGGLAAATRLAAGGLRVVVLDEGARAGGQIFRQLPEGLQPQPPVAEPPSHHRGHRLLAGAAVHGDRLEHRAAATVWHAQPGRLWFEQHGASWLLRCQRIVLAPGAYDRCVPFPGWTLPGVVTAGALQVMVRGFGVVPGRRALVAGSGPLLLPTVAALLAAGVEVVAALEASPRTRFWRALPAVLGSGAKLREAWWYARRLLAAGVRLRWGWTVFECRGQDAVQQAVIGRVDASGRPLRDTAETLAVDVVGVGFGLVPAIELAQLLGCATRYAAARGGHLVQVDGTQGTSVPGVFAVGEICGIGGAEVAVAEGELAAARVLHELRQQPVPERLVQRVVRERRTADALLAAFAPLPGLAALAGDDTIVCRCEDVRLSAVRAAAALHGQSLRAIKVGCRAGMGPCQGRICSPYLQALAADGPGMASLAAPLGTPDLPVAQVPAKAVRSATLVDAPRD